MNGNVAMPFEQLTLLIVNRPDASLRCGADQGRAPKDNQVAKEIK